MKFLFVGDVHATSRQHSARKVDRLLTLKEKFKAIKIVADENSVKFIVFAGDIFDKHIPTLNEFFFTKYLFTLLSPYRCILLPGNHDLLNANYDSLNTSGLIHLDNKIVTDSNNTKLLLEPLVVENVNLIPQHYTTQELSFNVEHLQSNTFNVLVSHNSIAPKGELPEVIDYCKASTIPDFYDIVLCGHIHSPFNYKNYVINVGSLYRCAVNELHEIAVGIVTLNAGEKPSVTYAYLNKYNNAVEKADTTFTMLSEDVQDDQVNMQQFVKLATTFTGSNKNIATYLDAAGKSLEASNDVMKCVHNYLSGE